MKSLTLIGILTLCISHSAIVRAQAADTDAEAASNEASSEPIEEITVTGTRILRDGTQTPTPVTAMTADELAASVPSNIPDALNKLPQFSGSTSETAGGTFNAGSPPLGNYLNLRGLSTARLLVLFNGQRVAPTTNTNAVDVNVLPQMLVSRVDVVTGGASAVYGSDAVSGVVNFILDEDFQGLKANAQAGTSSEGDSNSYKVGLAGGTDFGERMHFLGSIETYNTDGIPHLYDRSWAPDTFSMLIGNPIRFYDRLVRNTISDGGSVYAGALSTYYPAVDGHPVFALFNPDGTLAPMDMGNYIAFGNSDGGDGGVWGQPRNGGTSISGTLETIQTFGRVAFDASDTTRLYAQAIYATSDTSFNSTPNNHIGGSRSTRIYVDNPYLRPEVAAILTDAGEDSFLLGRIFNDIPLVTNETENEYKNLQLGIEGEFGESWQWDVTYNYGRAQLDSVWDEFSMREFWAAIDVVRDPATGNIVCGVTLRNPGYMDDCVPMNVIGDGNISDAAFNYARGDSISTITNKMQYVNANLQGDLFDLPAGPMVLAVGAEYRDQELTQTSNSNPAVWSTPDGIDEEGRAAFYEGIRGVPLTSNPLLFDSINIGIASGDQTVSEAYGELLVPVLSDAAFAQSLDIDLAARYTDYKTSGSVTTWKVGANWAPVNGLRFRVNQSRDIAAPDLYALYAGENVTFGAFNDTHLEDPDDQFRVPLYSTSGNPQLGPEEADTTTIGFVFQPEGVPGLALTVDWYSIDLQDAIANPNAQQMNAECEASNGTAEVCQYFVRNPNLPWSDRTAANAVTKIIISPQNLAFLETSGIDFEILYRFTLEDLMPSVGGEVTLQAFFNYLDQFDTQGNVDSPVVDWVGFTYGGNPSTTAGGGLPEWKGLLVQTWENERFSLMLRERFTGDFMFSFGSPTEVYEEPLKMPNKWYVDLNSSYTFGSDLNYQVFLNVQNLFDTDPPLSPLLVTNLNVPTLKGNYDVVGRYFTVGFRKLF